MESIGNSSTIIFYMCTHHADAADLHSRFPDCDCK